MKNKKPNKERITFAIEPSVVERIDQISEMTGSSRSAVIVRFILNGLEDEEKVIDQMGNPILRTIAKTLTTSPEMVSLISKMVFDSMSLDDAKDVKRNILQRSEEAEKRKTKKKDDNNE